MRACTLTFCCQQSVPWLAVLLLRKTKLEMLFYDVFICAPQDFPSMQLPVNVCALAVSKSLMCKNCNSKCWWEENLLRNPNTAEPSQREHCKTGFCLTITICCLESPWSPSNVLACKKQVCWHLLFSRSLKLTWVLLACKKFMLPLEKVWVGDTPTMHGMYGFCS